MEEDVVEEEIEGINGWWCTQWTEGRDDCGDCDGKRAIGSCFLHWFGYCLCLYMLL